LQAGGATISFVPLARAANGAWLVTPGIVGGQKGADTSCCKASELPRETQVPREGRARPGEETESNLRRIVPGAWWWNAPRPSPSASPFAGRRETEGLSWLARCVRAVRRSGAGMKCGRGSNRPLHARAGTTRGARPVRAGDSRRRKARGPWLGSVGPRASRTLGCVPNAGLDARVVPPSRKRRREGKERTRV
jgi:hypothetical protein